MEKNLGLGIRQARYEEFSGMKVETWLAGGASVNQ